MNDMTYEPGAEFPRGLDSEDALSSIREQFHFPQHDREVVYLCGNSLGLQPKKASEYVQRELDDWAKYAVRGHHPENKDHAWIPYHEFLAPSLARLVGASEREVVAMNTLTVNVQLMLASFYQPTSERYKVLRAYHGFPSDRYALESHIRVRGFNPRDAIIEVPPEEHEYFSLQRFEETLASHASQIALVMMDGVNYYTGQVLPMKEITALAHKHDIPVGFDLAHGVGNVLLSLHDWDVDFAAWCTYKYLNGGPGCVAGAFVHERYAKDFTRPRLAGWWGHDKASRFKMGPEFLPNEGADGWQLSNPPILPLAALRASLEVFDDVGIEQLRAKSIQLTGYLEFLLNQIDAVTIFTPSNPEERGCQLSIFLGSHGREVFERISDAGVFCDWREPNIIRVAPVPLYNSFQDVFRFVEILKEAIEQ